MDPIANLAEQRKLAAQITDLIDTGAPDVEPDATNVRHDAARLAELMLTLDEWRISGGFDPYAAPVVKGRDLMRNTRPGETREGGPMEGDHDFRPIPPSYDAEAAAQLTLKRALTAYLKTLDANEPEISGDESIDIATRRAEVMAAGRVLQFKITD